MSDKQYIINEAKNVHNIIVKLEENIETHRKDLANIMLHYAKSEFINKVYQQDGKYGIYYKILEINKVEYGWRHFHIYVKCKKVFQNYKYDTSRKMTSIIYTDENNPFLKYRSEIIDDMDFSLELTSENINITGYNDVTDNINYINAVSYVEKLKDINGTVINKNDKVNIIVNGEKNWGLVEDYNPENHQFKILICDKNAGYAYKEGNQLEIIKENIDG